MTTRTLALAALLVAATAGPVLAQTPPAAPQPGTRRARGRHAAARRAAQPPPAAAPAAAAPERPRREGQPINIKVDLTLTDQRGGAPPSSARSPCSRPTATPARSGRSRRWSRSAACR